MYHQLLLQYVGFGGVSGVQKLPLEGRLGLDALTAPLSLKVRRQNSFPATLSYNNASQFQAVKHANREGMARCYYYERKELACVPIVDASKSGTCHTSARFRCRYISISILVQQMTFFYLSLSI